MFDSLKLIAYRDPTLLALGILDFWAVMYGIMWVVGQVRAYFRWRRSIRESWENDSIGYGPRLWR